jgi:hypothetical protein
LLSLLLSKPVPYLSLPCCLHALNAPFTLTKFVPPFEHPFTPERGFGHGLDEGESRYKTYLMWLGWSGLMCGWKWEKEGMRVPSTKGWGIIGMLLGANQLGGRILIMDSAPQHGQDGLPASKKIIHVASGLSSRLPKSGRRVAFRCAKKREIRIDRFCT